MNVGSEALVGWRGDYYEVDGVVLITPLLNVPECDGLEDREIRVEGRLYSRNASA